jgi:hypothetical protein
VRFSIARRTLVAVLATAAVAIVVAPAGAGPVADLCTSTKTAVQTSPTYATLSPFQKLVANSLATSACSAVAAAEPTMTLAEKEALVARYQAALGPLVSAGLLTPQQAQVLQQLAVAVVNPVTITSISPNPTVGCHFQTFVITGTGFVAGSTSVSMPWAILTLTVDSPTQLTVQTDFGVFAPPGTHLVTVTTPAGSASTTLTTTALAGPGGCMAPE